MRKPKLRIYGYDETMHRTNFVDVETNEDGQVVAVWFRHMPVRFEQCLIGPARAEEMKKMYKNSKPPKLHAIVVED